VFGVSFEPYLPATQFVQAVALVPLNVPAAHEKHSYPPATGRYVPAGHNKHVDMLVACSARPYLPVAQSVQDARPVPAYEP
jgi:hypothetical protein